MSQFIISSKESRIENNRSFYGCFYLGPFEPSQSITIANTLRRTLLSEIYGLAIVSVEIEGASHEYSSLPGVQESVLDILLNIKEIVLKKTNNYFTPQIGYLRVQGPGVVTASHLRLPPFIQCVDPDQYIATLSHNGCLNIKFIIQYGNKWLAAGRKPELGSQNFSEMSIDDNSLGGANVKSQTIQDGQTVSISRQSPKGLSKPVFNFYFKKRRLFLKKLRDFGVSGSNSYIKLFSKNLTRLFKYKKKRDINLKTKNKQSLNLILKLSKKYPGINLKNGTFLNTKNLANTSSKPNGLSHQYLGRKKGLKNQKFQPSFSNLSKTIPNPGKINKHLQTLNVASTPGKNKGGSLRSATEVHRSLENRKKQIFFNAASAPFGHRLDSLNIDAIFNPITKVNYIIEINDFKIAQNKLQISHQTSELYDTLSSIGPNKKSSSEGYKLNPITLESGIEQDLLNLLNLNQELSALTKETIKHNIILEIWTNGSLHPRDALNQALKNLIKVFMQLKNVQPFGNNSLNSNLVNAPSKPFGLRLLPTPTKNKGGSLTSNYEGQRQSNKLDEKTPKSKIEQILLKKMKMGELKTQFLESLLPLNETNYLSTYISPKVRSYYFNKTNLVHILNSASGKNSSPPIFIAGRWTPDISIM